MNALGNRCAVRLAILAGCNMTGTSCNTSTIVASIATIDVPKSEMATAIEPSLPANKESVEPRIRNFHCCTEAPCYAVNSF